MKFYDLLKAINANCFQAASRRFTVPSRGSPSASKRQALFYLPEAQLILFVARASGPRKGAETVSLQRGRMAAWAEDSLIWAMKHEQPQVADSGLQAPETRSAP